MKTLIEQKIPLYDLETYIRSKCRPIAEELMKRHDRKKAPSASKDDALLTPAQELFQKTHAAKTIVHAWRGRKVKEKIAKSPYFSYLSLIDPTDEQYILSVVMFGRHVAELQATSKDRIANPYTHSKAFYHRDDDLSGALLTNLLLQFNIPLKQAHLYEYIPITNLRNTPIEQLLRHYFPQPGMMPKLHHQDHDSIILLAIPKSSTQLTQIKNVVRAAGLIASPWEIAANVTVVTKGGDKISLDSKLPKTKEALLTSKIMGKLKAIASDSRHSTQKLAESLNRMLHELPGLSPEAIQRIALMLDMTNTFYEHNYPRYAFCVYAIVHEISLALLKQSDKGTLERDYNKFQIESEETLLSALGLSCTP
jgi:hypothetical protein